MRRRYELPGRPDRPDALETEVVRQVSDAVRRGVREAVAAVAGDHADAVDTGGSTGAPGSRGAPRERFSDAAIEAGGAGYATPSYQAQGRPITLPLTSAPAEPEGADPEDALAAISPMPAPGLGLTFGGRGAPAQARPHRDPAPGSASAVPIGLQPAVPPPGPGPGPGPLPGSRAAGQGRSAAAPGIAPWWPGTAAPAWPITGQPPWAPVQTPTPQLDEPPQDRPSEQLAGSLRVTIVAHASPRWRGAKDAAEADKNNMELSRQRMEQIFDVVDVRLQDTLGPGVRIDYDLEYDQPDQPGSVVVTHESHGSHDTLHAAKGNRDANDPYYRRVDVYIDDTATTRDYSVMSTPRRSTKVIMKTTNWQVRVGVTGDASLVGAIGIVALRLRNGDTGREGDFHIIGVGPGTIGVSVSKAVSEDYTDFSTDEPVGFADFAGAGVNYSTFGVGLVFFDYEKSYLSFPSMGEGAKDIDVSGWNVGAELKVGGNSISSFLGADGSGPPSDEYEFHSDYEETSSDTQSKRGDLYMAFFETGEYVLPPKDRTELRKFVDAATVRFRQSMP